MFLLSKFQDKFQISPQNFNQNIVEALSDQIEKKYTNKVIPDVGLGVCLYDVTEMSDGIVYPSDGCAHYKVGFRLVVFRPFVGEVLVGTVKSCDHTGIKVSLGFFHDVFIPSYLLQNPSVYFPHQNGWQWQCEECPGGEFFMEIGEKIRFRVVALNFTKVTATQKGKLATTTQTEFVKPTSESLPSTNQPGRAEQDQLPLPGPLRRRSLSLDLTAQHEDPAPMKLIATINEDGLGLVSWWC